MLQEAFFFTLLINLVVSSIFGGLFLMFLAKYLGKIPQARFSNSFLVCLISNILYFVAWYLLGIQKALALGFAIVLIINLGLLAVSYIVVGKYIWKSTWLASAKANSVWIVLYAALMGYALTYFV